MMETFYHSVTLGTQTWTMENLKTTTYNDGSALPLVTDGTAWATLTTPAYCWYNNDTVTYKNIYGALYNWYAVNTGALAPPGWHVPTDADWNTLQNYLIANGYNWGYDNNRQQDSKIKWQPRQIGLPIQTPGTIGNNVSANNRSDFLGTSGRISCLQRQF